MWWFRNVVDAWVYTCVPVDCCQLCCVCVCVCGWQGLPVLYGETHSSHSVDSTSSVFPFSVGVHLGSLFLPRLESVCSNRQPTLLHFAEGLTSIENLLLVTPWGCHCMSPWSGFPSLVHTCIWTFHIFKGVDSYMHERHRIDVGWQGKESCWL